MHRFFRMQGILILIISFPAILFSQAPDTIWTRTYGGAVDDDCFSIAKTTYSYVCGGYTNSSGAGLSDYWLFKVTDNGDIGWPHTYGTSAAEFCYSMVATNDGGFILTGQQDEWFMDCLFYTVKVNSSGGIQWERNYEYAGSFGHGVRQTTDSGYILAGCTPWHFCSVKINEIGDTIWTGEYHGVYNAYGEDVQEYINYNSPTREKYYLTVGCTGAGSTNHSWDVYIVLTDSIGEIITSRLYGRPRFGSDDWASSIEPTLDGNFIVAGSTMSFGNGGYDVWLMKINYMGDTIWTRTYGGPSNDCGMHAIQDLGGGFVIAGYTESFGAGGKDVFVLKTDNNGNLLWSKTIGGFADEVARRVIVTGKHEYIVVGYTESYGAGDRDAYIIKLGGVGSELNDPYEVFMPDNPELFQNYPNPFNSSTQIEYYLPAAAKNLSIEFYDILGCRVALLRGIDNGMGFHQLIWQPSDLSTGVYFYKIQAGEYSQTRRMMLIK
jgi:hypothetical protein